MRSIFIICCLSLLPGCTWNWIKYGGRDPAKTVFLDVGTGEKHDLGFGSAFWAQRAEGNVELVGYGWHPMEHRVVVRKGNYEPYPAFQPKWFYVRLRGLGVEVELKLGQGTRPDGKTITYRGQASVRQLRLENDVLRVELSAVELVADEGEYRPVVAGSIVARRVSEEEFGRRMGLYREARWER